MYPVSNPSSSIRCAPMSLVGHHSVIIIGAGICGITIAKKLQVVHDDVMIMEKSADDIGGKMSSIHCGEVVGETGCHSFEVTSLPIREMCLSLKGQGLVDSVRIDIDGDRKDEERWFPMGGARLLPLILAGGLDILRGAEVVNATRVCDDEGRWMWQLLCGNGEMWSCDWLIATTPIPVTKMYLDSQSMPTDWPLLLASVTYDPLDVHIVAIPKSLWQVAEEDLSRTRGLYRSSSQSLSLCRLHDRGCLVNGADISTLTHYHFSLVVPAGANWKQMLEREGCIPSESSLSSSSSSSSSTATAIDCLSTTTYTYGQCTRALNKACLYSPVHRVVLCGEGFIDTTHAWENSLLSAQAAVSKLCSHWS
jgi:hypothetical protein